jgi:phosphoribosylanthranilate isomerase
LEEALLAERHGADAFGLLVGRRHASADFISVELAADICSRTPPYITSVVVTHMEEPDEIIRLAEIVPSLALQIHSNASASILAALRERLRPRKIVGKVSVLDASAIARAREIEKSVDAIVLDSADPRTNRVGGTGLVHDWSISAAIVSQVNVPVILAGGLNPENVSKAIATVRPWAVDVHSGVETADGKKSEERLRRFIHNSHQESP